MWSDSNRQYLPEVPPYGLTFNPVLSSTFVPSGEGSTRLTVVNRTPEGTRTPNLRVRSAALCPVELQAYVAE
jgi:hypothetical protein